MKKATPENKTEATNDVGKTKDDTLKVEVLNAEGEVIRTFKTAAKAGVNRTSWSLNRKGVRSPNRARPKRPDAREPAGPPVLPGTYTVRITNGDQNATANVNVKFDPRLEVSEADLQKRNTMMERVMTNTAVITEAADRLRDARKTVGMVNGRIKERKEDNIKALEKQGKALQDSIKALLESINGKEVQGIRRDPLTVNSRLRTAMSYLRASIDAPGETERIAVEQAERSLEDALAKINKFFNEDWAAYQQAVEAANISFFESYEELTIKN